MEPLEEARIHTWILKALSSAGLSVQTLEKAQLPERLRPLHGRKLVARAQVQPVPTPPPAKLPSVDYRLNEEEWKRCVAFAQDFGLLQRGMQ